MTVDLSPSIMMANGRYFSPFARTASESLDATSLALGCARECRYSGQLPLALEDGGSHLSHYSVAEHTVLLVRHAALFAPCDVVLQQELAIHDLHETISRDLASPLKSFVPGYREFENTCHMAVRRAFGMPLNAPSDTLRLVDSLDKSIQIDEQLALFPGSEPWAARRAGYGPLGVGVRKWPSGVAFDELMHELARLFPEVM